MVCLRNAVLLASTAILAASAPISNEDSTHLNILFVNDFTLDFIDDRAALSKAKSSDGSVQQQGKSVSCPGRAYPQAATQFDFTAAIVEAISTEIDLTLQYDFIRGGEFAHLSPNVYTRETFFTGASAEFKDFCFEGPEKSDLPAYVKNVLFHAHDVDVLVLFTASSPSELAAALPIEDKEFKAVIIVGMNGADASSFYPDTAISIADFEKPENVACMINVAFSDIQQRKPVQSPVKQCLIA